MLRTSIHRVRSLHCFANARSFCSRCGCRFLLFYLLLSSLLKSSFNILSSCFCSSLRTDMESSKSRVTFTFLVTHTGREILLSSETTSLAEQRWKPKKCGMEESVFSIIWSGVLAAAAEAEGGGEGGRRGAQACQGTCQDTCMRPSCGCTLKLQIKLLLVDIRI